MFWIIGENDVIIGKFSWAWTLLRRCLSQRMYFSINDFERSVCQEVPTYYIDYYCPILSQLTV